MLPDEKNTLIHVLEQADCFIIHGHVCHPVCSFTYSIKYLWDANYVPDTASYTYASFYSCLQEWIQSASQSTSIHWASTVLGIRATPLKFTKRDFQPPGRRLGSLKFPILQRRTGTRQHLSLPPLELGSITVSLLHMQKPRLRRTDWPGHSVLSDRTGIFVKFSIVK